MKLALPLCVRLALFAAMEKTGYCLTIVYQSVLYFVWTLLWRSYCFNFYAVDIF